MDYGNSYFFYVFLYILFRDDIKRAGGQPKDHAKENIRFIKQIQKNNKLKQEVVLHAFRNVSRKKGTRKAKTSSIQIKTIRVCFTQIGYT